MRKKITFLFTLALGFAMLVPGARASAQATLSLAAVSGDNVRITVTGEPSCSVRLSFLPSGATSVTSIVIGATDSGGNFSTSISSGGYGIPQGSPAYVTVNGMQSATALWPAYSSSLTLSSASISIAVGQSLTVTGSNALILAANGISTVVSTAISGSQLTVTGLANGSGALALCGANAGCGVISISVGNEGSETNVSFSDNNFTIYGSQRKEVSIYGGAIDGYSIVSNSNPNAVDASVRARGDLIVIYAGAEAGTVTIRVCSKDTISNCANLVVTSLSDSATNSLTFSPNDIILNPGLTQNVTVSGGPDNSYYISSNSNSGVVTAAILNNIVTLTGGGNAGSASISVCSATQNATCGNLNVTLSINSDSASLTTLSFSQNVVSIGKTESTNVTVNGGSGNGYVISANSNPTAASANITGSSNIISITGVEVGSSVITVCSSGSGSVCSSIYVSVGPELTAITFSRNNVALTSRDKILITITGGSGTGKIISANSNPNAVSASLNGDGSVIIISGNSVSGASSITVCSSTYSNNCGILTAAYTAPAANTNEPSGSDTSGSGTTDSNASGSNNSGSVNEGTSASAARDMIQTILAEASDVIHENGITRDLALEAKTNTAYTNALTAGNKNIDDVAARLLTGFIAYGTATTKNIGAGERAGVLNSYQKAFGKLPATEAEWADAIKIANGRWPSETSAAAINSAKVEFKKVYKREADLGNPNDNAAVSIIAYGLRPASRNINSEKAAIKTFRAVYGHDPVNALAWDIVRAIAYSGAKR